MAIQVSSFPRSPPINATWSKISAAHCWLSLNAGFGRAYALEASDLKISADISGWDEMESGVIEHMNSDHSSAVDTYARKIGCEGDGWRMSCIDPEGMDLIRGDEKRRFWFDPPLQSTAEIRQRLVSLARS